MRSLWVIATIAWSSGAAAEVACPDAIATKLTYARGRSNLTIAAKRAIDLVYEILRAAPTQRLVIIGHVAGTTDPDPEVTAKRRAEVVKWYLVDEGIETQRVETRVSTVVLQRQVIELQLDPPARCTPAPRDDRRAAPRMFDPRIAPLRRADRIARTSTTRSASVSERTAATASELAARVTDSDRGHLDIGANLSHDVDVARGEHATIGAPQAGFREVASPRLGDSASLDLRQPTWSSSSPIRRDVELGRIRASSPEVEPASPFSHEVVRHQINTRYMPGLSRCYRRQLIADPALSGRVRLSFAVDDTGRLVGGRAAGVDADLDGCIRSQMSGWRFAIRRGDTGTARFSISLVFQSI